MNQHIVDEIAQYYRDHNLWPTVIDEYYAMYGYPHGHGYHYSDHNPFRVNTASVLMDELTTKAEEESLRYPERKYHTHISFCEKAPV